MSGVMAVDDLGAAIERAAEKIDAGVPIGLPTDTVYVLAGDPSDPGLTDRLFSLKHRPRSFDLSLLVSSVEEALELATALPDAAGALMKRFWPGPLTLVLPRHPEVEFDLGDDDLTVGVRVPDHPVARALCDEVGPLVATPAGLQGGEVCHTAAQVAEAFGAWVPLVLDGGVCDRPQATVVDVTGESPHLLREGPITWEEIEATL